jgi:hypothetical protein
MRAQQQKLNTMEKNFARLTSLVADEPRHSKAALAEARVLLAQIATGRRNHPGTEIGALVATIGRGVSLWFGPHQWDEHASVALAVKADLLADLLKLQAALLLRRADTVAHGHG